MNSNILVTDFFNVENDIRDVDSTADFADFFYFILDLLDLLGWVWVGLDGMEISVWGDSMSISLRC